jgi:DNA-3-methyladenine glycosylase
VHYLVNVVTEPAGCPAAVLIRALEPLDGTPLMRKRRARWRTARHQTPRRRIPDHDLCKGPGNVTHAMGISLRENRLDLLGNVLYIEDRGQRVTDVRWSPRIGITKGTDKHWRVFADASTSVSGRPLGRARL